MQNVQGTEEVSSVPETALVPVSDAVPAPEKISYVPAREPPTSVERAFSDITIPTVNRGGICRLFGLFTLGIGRFFEIPEGFIMVVMAFARYRTYKEPGLRGILSFWGFYKQPWKHLVPSHERMEHFGVAGARTFDGMECDIDAFFSFKIVEPGKAIFDVVNFAEIKTVAMGLVRDECGKRRAAELLSARAEMAQAAKANLTPDADRWGLAIPIFDVLEIRLKD